MTILTGYCTNVHAGADLATTRANLERHALAVKERLGQESLGIGLWLSAAAVRELHETRQVDEFRDWLWGKGLIPFTVNGFPHGDFHQEVVKHRVYFPTWDDPARLEYTRDLYTALHGLLPPGVEGGISTLPLAWGDDKWNPERMKAVAAQLVTLANELHRLEQDTERLIHLDIEPEPGCVLQRSEDVVRLFEEYLFPDNDEAVIRRYLRVCHDVCHASVMFEEQGDVLRRYRQAGIAVGKVQVSAAVVVPWDDLAEADRLDAKRQLTAFDERRYLHQTCIRDQGRTTFHEDLDSALREEPRGEWRVHFHVPVYLQGFGKLKTSQHDILEAIRLVEGCRHWEVETYAWGVLPESLRQPELASGIAKELVWFTETWDRMKGKR